VSWEQELASSYRTMEQLSAAGFITKTEVAKLSAVAKRYKFLLPKYYADLIDRDNPVCPIRLQAIPSLAELEAAPGELSDPLQDLTYQPVERMTHRYGNRVLLHLTPNCSMYCRFCFRKTLLNELKEELFSGALIQAFKYLRDNTAIEEVIFSGGDPLMVGDEILKQVLEELHQISHLKRIRIHSRIPVTLPSRVTPKLLESLTSSRFKVVVVTHFNHPKEITAQAKEAIKLLKAGTFLLNQSVLLKGVNDSAQVLVQLSESLFEEGVLPYYLHQLDPSQGTHQFLVPVEEGKKLFGELKKRLPGYLVPRYVRDVVGIPYKTSLAEF